MSRSKEIAFPSSGWDRTFLKASSTLAEPLCQAYGLFRYRLIAPLDPNKFNNCSTRTREVGLRTLIALGAACGLYLLSTAPASMTCAALVLAGGSKLFRSIGFSLQKAGYTHVRGNAPEKIFTNSLKIMSWNVCGIGGGFSYDHGGVIDWRSRLDGIVKKIEQESPDVLVLQEIYDADLGEALIRRLKDSYAHFYLHLGKSVMGSVGGCMVLTKCAVHRFSNTDFSTNNWKLKRGFAMLEIGKSPESEIPSARIIGTHLIHGTQEKDREIRVKQVAQIVDHVARQELAIPTVLAGDFNIDRDGEEAEILRPYLRHGYILPEATATNRLVEQWNPKAKGVEDETIDYISLFKERQSFPVIETGVQFTECYLSLAFDETFDTRTALSDHHAVVATIDLGMPLA